MSAEIEASCLHDRPGDPQRRGLLIIISSPSGAGKSTLARRLMAWDPTIRFSVSVTTRPPRPGERHGVDYHFIDRPTFARMAAGGELLEHAEVFGNHYGTPRAQVLEAIEEGRDILFDIDWQGGQQIRNSDLADDVVSIFILPPSIAALEERLRGRGQDPEEVIARRMAKARDEISHWAEYDYVFVNDDVDCTAERLRAIVTAERWRRSRRPGLVAHVRGLMEEFESGYQQG